MERSKPTVVYRYFVFTTHTAGLHFAEVAARRGADVWIGCRSDSALRGRYERAFPNRVVCFEHIRELGLTDSLRSIAPHFIVTCVFDWKVPADICRLATIEAVNLHPARLPQLRGGDVAFWNVLLSNGHFDITMHRLSEQWDAGDVLHRLTFPMDSRETRLSFIEKVEQCWKGSSETLQRVLEDQTYSPQVQRHTTRFLRSPAGQRFRLGTWECGQYLDRLVRAAEGRWVVQVAYHDEWIEVVAAVASVRHGRLSPGTLEVEDGRKVHLHTRSAACLELLVLRSPDHGTMDAEQFIHRYQVQTGCQLGAFPQDDVCAKIYALYREVLAAAVPIDDESAACRME